MSPVAVNVPEAGSNSSDEVSAGFDWDPATAVGLARGRP